MTIIWNVVLVLLTIAAGLLVWSAVEPYFIDIEDHDVTIPRLSEAWDGRRVAVIADLQVGMWASNTWTIERIVRRIVRERPAAVLLVGDFVYHAGGDPAPVRRVARLLEPLREAGLPTYAVLGNHDYDMPSKGAPANETLASAVREALRGIGVRVLENESVPLPKPNGEPPLHLVGIGAHVPGHDDVPAALAEVPEAAPRLVMMHHPNSYHALPPGSAPLAVAAHTHGGQFRIPFTPDWTWMTYTSDDEVHTDGFDETTGADGNRLYVNRGIGFSVVPLRLNCPPELTMFTLRREARDP